MENWGLKHPREKIIYSFFYVAFHILELGWVGDDWGGIGAAWRMYLASIWTHSFKNENLKEPFNILSFKHGSDILKQWGSKITI